MSSKGEEAVGMLVDEDIDSTWAGGRGFYFNGAQKKWKTTRKLFFIWPMYSESLTLTDKEIHIKRNDCPALPRECRPFRSWAVVPLRKVQSYYMKKELSTRSLLLYLMLSVIIGIFAGAAVVIYGSSTEVDATDAQQILAATKSFTFVAYTLLAVLVSFMALFIIQTFRAPLRLVIRADGINSDGLSIDLHSKYADPEEIKVEIDAARRKLRD